MVRIFQSVPLS